MFILGEYPQHTGKGEMVGLEIPSCIPSNSTAPATLPHRIQQISANQQGKTHNMDMFSLLTGRAGCIQENQTRLDAIPAG